MKKDVIVNAIESAISELEREQPEPKQIFSYYQHSLTEAGFAIVPLDVLHDFFNSKSDANKYLMAEQQEDLEAEFNDYLLSL